MKTLLVWSISAACAAVALTAAPDAQAKSYVFKFGDEDAVCRTGQNGGKPEVVCEVANPKWTNVPPRPSTCQGVWGDRIGLVQGAEPALQCHSDSLTSLQPQYASGAQINGAISCIDTEPWAGTKCTDTSTGNYFNIAVNSFQLSPAG